MRSLVVLLIVCSACTYRQRVPRGRHPPIMDGREYQLTTRTGHTFPVHVIRADGDRLLVSDGTYVHALQHHEIASLSRKSRSMGWVHGFAWTMAIATVIGLAAAATFTEDDDCDLACDQGARFAVFPALGLVFGLTWGGAIGALAGRDYVYRYE